MIQICYFCANATFRTRVRLLRFPVALLCRGNIHVQNVVKILGLKFSQQYTDTKSLRYGHLMIMTDQDHDGSHIKGEDVPLAASLTLNRLVSRGLHRGRRWGLAVFACWVRVEL